MTHPSRLAHRGLLLATGLFLVAVTVLLLRTRTLPTLGGIRLSAAWLMDDFKIVAYCPAHLLLHGGNPYDRAQFLAFCPVDEGMPMYLPLIFLMHVPFGLLSLDTAVVSYFIVTILLMVALALAAYRLSGLPVTPAHVMLIAALLLLSRPGQWNTLLGQPAVVLVLASYVALYYARRLPWLSGLGLALAASKPTFGVPLMVLMLARGDWRPVAAGTVLITALNLPLIAVLASRAGSVQTLAQEALEGQAAWEAMVQPTRSGAPVDLDAFLGRLRGKPLPTSGEVVLTLAVLGVAAVALRRIGPRSDAAVARLSNDVICISTLVAVHHHAYDLLLLTAPVVVLASRGLPSGYLSRRWEIALYVLYGVLATNYLASLAVLSHLEDHPVLWMMIASLNGAALLAIFLVYVSRTTRIVNRRIGSTAAHRTPAVEGLDPLGMSSQS